MNREEIKNTIKEWILRINRTERIPEQIIAINFGLYEPYGVELTGSVYYDADDDDWACDEDFEPSERCCPELGIDEEEEWETVLELIESILKELAEELPDTSIFSVEHITTGFSDGELKLVK